MHGETKVTGTVVKLRVAGKSASSLMVTKEPSRGRKGKPELCKELGEEHGFSEACERLRYLASVATLQPVTAALTITRLHRN